MAESIFVLNPAHLKLHDQFVPLIDMKLLAQNQLDKSISFWDVKDLEASLSMPGYAWPHPSKITSSICSFDRYVPACRKLPPIVLRY